MKRICFFFGHYSPSMQVIMEYYEKIFPKNIELFLICANKVDKEKYHFKRIKIFEFLDKKQIVPFKLRRFLRNNKIDLLIGFGGQSEIAIVLFIATIFTSIKTTFYCLVNPKAEPRNYFFLFSQFFTTRFLACCKEVSDNFKKFLFLKRKNIFYLPCPINTNIFKFKNKIELRKKFGFKEDDKILFYVGRIEVEQGSDYLLKLIKKNPDKKFLLIGELRDENFKNKEFENLVHVPFVPNKELPDYYNAVDLVLFFSKRNSYPYPPRESLACGIPIILFDLNTYGQLTTKAAIKIPFDVGKIQQEIDRFFLLPKKEKERLSEEGRKFVIEDSSEEKVKDLTLSYFLDLLE